MSPALAFTSPSVHHDDNMPRGCSSQVPRVPDSSRGDSKPYLDPTEHTIVRSYIIKEVRNPMIQGNSGLW